MQPCDILLLSFGLWDMQYPPGGVEEGMRGFRKRLSHLPWGVDVGKEPRYE